MSDLLGHLIYLVGVRRLPVLHLAGRSGKIQCPCNFALFKLIYYFHQISKQNHLSSVTNPEYTFVILR
jgi:hypothetical protein